VSRGAAGSGSRPAAVTSGDGALVLLAQVEGARGEDVISESRAAELSYSHFRPKM
jgi:hypothetical protein